jgi:predicted enzyme related to lactoylglutathione lyase
VAERQSYPDGTPCYVDIGAPDLEAACRFYAALFGWDIIDLGPDAGGYRQAQVRGKAVVGLGPAQNPGPPYWTTYISTSDVDATSGKVTRSGGTVVVEPLDVLDAGRMAVYQDPEGAFFSAWEAKNSIGAELVNEPGALSWNELNTRDLEKAKAFYASVFGWGAATSTAPGGDYTEWKLGDRSVGGCLVMGEGFPAEVPPHWLAYFAVADIGGATAKAKELGAAVMMEGMDTPAGKMSVVADPQGAVFAMIQLVDADS